MTVRMLAAMATSAVPCRSCGEPLPGRDGGLVLKYFLLWKAGRIERRA